MVPGVNSFFLTWIVESDNRINNLEKLDLDFLLLIQLNNFDSWLGRVPVPCQKSLAGLWLAELHHLTWTLASDWSIRRGILGPHVFAWSILCQHCKQENIHYLQYLQFTAEIVNSGCSSQMTGVRIPSLDFNCHDIEQGHCSHDRCSKPYRPPSTILPSSLMGPNYYYTVYSEMWGLASRKCLGCRTINKE